MAITQLSAFLANRPGTLAQAVTAISDAGVGAVCCKAALQGASLNVFINTKSMKDRERAEAYEKEAEAMLDKYCRLADEIYETVIGRIK